MTCKATEATEATDPTNRYSVGGFVGTVYPNGEHFEWIVTRADTIYDAGRQRTLTRAIRCCKRCLANRAASA